MSDSRLHEIITKAVVGRAERRMIWNHTVPAEGVTGVLGVHISDTTVAVKEKDRRAVVDVTVDLDLWCGNAKQTKVIRCTARNTEVMEIRTIGRLYGEPEMKARLVEPCRAKGVTVADDGITLRFEADISVQVSGFTRMWVRAYDMEAAVLGDLDDPEDDDSGSGSRSDSSSDSDFSSDFSSTSGE